MVCLDVTFIESAHGDEFRTVQPAVAAAVGSGGGSGSGFGVRPSSSFDDAELAAASFTPDDASPFSGPSPGADADVDAGAGVGGGGRRGEGKKGSESSDKKGSESSDKVVVSTLFDGVGSWWTQGVGHGHHAMALALAEAAGRYVQRVVCVCPAWVRRAGCTFRHTDPSSPPLPDTDTSSSQRICTRPRCSWRSIC